MSVISGAADRKSRLSDLRGVATPGRIAAGLVGLTALIVAVWPFGLTSDYLNHLARNYIEAQIWFDDDLQKYYGLSFSVIPDLTMDMIVPWLAHVTGIYAAGAVTVWIALVAPPLAGLLIARNLYGRVTWCSLAGFLVIFNANMQWGFVNFVASTGLALLGFALWMNLAPRWSRVILIAPFGAFLALNHALGFLLFGYLVLLWEIACFAHGQRGTRRSFAVQLLMRDVLTMVPGLLIIAFATGNAQQLTHVGVADFDILQKVGALWAGTEFFNPVLGRLVTIAFIVAVFMGLRRGLLRIEPRMAWVCGGMLLLVLVMPTSLFGIWGLHFRYPAVLIIIAAASLRLDTAADDSRARLVAAGTAALLIAIFVNGALQMASIDRQARELRSVVAQLPQGARLLPARDEGADLSFALHSAAMAVIERSAYVPNLFTNTSPVDVHPQMRAQHMPQAWPLLKEKLERSRQLALPQAENGHWSPYYYYGWPHYWDYVLYMRTNEDQELDIASLCPVAERMKIVLYRIGGEICDNRGALVNAALRPSLRQ